MRGINGSDSNSVMKYFQVRALSCPDLNQTFIFNSHDSSSIAFHQIIFISNGEWWVGGGGWCEY